MSPCSENHEPQSETPSQGQRRPTWSNSSPSSCSCRATKTSVSQCAQHDSAIKGFSAETFAQVQPLKYSGIISDDPAKTLLPALEKIPLGLAQEHAAHRRHPGIASGVFACLCVRASTFVCRRQVIMRITSNQASK